MITNTGHGAALIALEMAKIKSLSHQEVLVPASKIYEIVHSYTKTDAEKLKILEGVLIGCGYKADEK